MARARRTRTPHPNGQVFSTRQTDVNPGDEATPGTPGTGEDTCPHCRGSGRIDGVRCAHCGGSGLIVEGIGGA